MLLDLTVRLCRSTSGRPRHGNGRDRRSFPGQKDHRFIPAARALSTTHSTRYWRRSVSADRKDRALVTACREGIGPPAVCIPDSALSFSVFLIQRHFTHRFFTTPHTSHHIWRTSTYKVTMNHIGPSDHSSLTFQAIIPSGGSTSVRRCLIQLPPHLFASFNPVFLRSFARNVSNPSQR